MTASSLPNTTEKRLSTPSIRSNKVAPAPTLHSSTTKAVELNDNNTSDVEGASKLTE